jgi:hypothetical protein
MAAGVYSFLRLYVPKEKPQCPQDVSLIIEEAKCQGTTLKIVLVNHGLFNVQGVYVKSGKSGDTYKTILNCLDKNDVNNCILHFGPTQKESADLMPEENWTGTFTNNLLTGIQEIEIQPLVIVDRTIAVCDKAIITQKINCG